jgi:protease-4
MSEASDSPSPIRPEDEAPMVLPARYASRPRPPMLPLPRRSGGGFGRVLLVLFLFASLAVNFILAIMLFASYSGESSEDNITITERTWSGSSTARNKVAVVRVEGPIFEDLPTFPYQLKQIDKAGKDSAVKAVVLSVNSPGGTITGSDELHKRLMDMKKGESPRYKSDAKPLVVSMQSMAASGGYYISMPGDYIYAQRTTITGSIGVYASFLNLTGLGEKYGVHMELIKAGAIKGSGSMFQTMTPQERQPWQDMVNESYATFVKVVEEGRPKLKGKLTKDLVLKDANGKEVNEVDVYDQKGNKVEKAKAPYHRQLADGGIFTIAEAKEFGLIDEVGYLDAACKEAAKRAGLSDGDYKVVMYDRPVSFLSLLGADTKQRDPLDMTKLASASTPRLWFMVPNAEMSAILTSMANK